MWDKSRRVVLFLASKPFALKCSHNSGSNEQKPFFSSKIFSGQRTGHWHGVSFLGWTSKCPSSNQSLPYFKWATSSSGKGRTFETFAGYSRNQSLPGLHRVDPYPMSCHPCALLAATNDPESQISKINEYSVKKNSDIKHCCVGGMHFTGKLQILVWLPTVLHHQRLRTKTRSTR